MRFIALAFTFLLAGCQAHFLQDEFEPPSQLDNVKSSLINLKQFAHKALNHLDDTEFKDYKEFLGQYVDYLHYYFQYYLQGITPFAGQIAEATAPMREKFMKDVEDMHKQLEPKREELRQVLEKHILEYITELKPIVDKYLAKQRKEMKKLKVNLEPVVKTLKEKILVNWEETKSKLLPILEIVRNKVTAQVQYLRDQLEPYIQDYKDYLEKRMLEFRESVQSGELRTKIYHLGAKVKPHFEAMVEALQETFNSV